MKVFKCGEDTLMARAEFALLFSLKGSKLLSVKKIVNNVDKSPP